MSGELARALAERAGAARARGALEPIPTELVAVEDDGVRFAVRVAAASARLPPAAARAGAARSPFLPFEPELFVAEASDTHVCLLNKYPVLEGHALLVTRTFEEQESPLTRADFAALVWALERMRGLGFYNSGPAAGASQRHKHLQLVPLPLGDGPEPIPGAPRVRAALPGGAGPRFPFAHAAAPVGAAAGPDALLAAWRELARELGLGDPPARPYNLLVARDWLLGVPRDRADWQGIAVNALGFAGALFARDRAGLERVRRAGPFAVLRAVSLEYPGARRTPWTT